MSENIVSQVEEILAEPMDPTGFDISAEQAAAALEDSGYDMPVKGINGEPAFWKNPETGNVEPVTIRVVGANSSRFRAIEKKLRERVLKPKQFTGQAMYEDSVEKAAACTLGWNGIHDRGNPAPFSVNNAKVLYKKLPFLLNQVTEAMNDHSLFSESSSMTQ